MKRNTILAAAGGLALGIAGTAAVTTQAAPAPMKSSSRVLLENDLVRVKEAIFAPGDTRPGMHTHELAHVGVPLDDGRLTFTYADGTTETLDLKRGTAGFRAANVTHEAVNRGDTPVRVIEVEIKEGR
jgi:mannose-6-phosphate isomerase-like protein (cupin superfamily)